MVETLWPAARGGLPIRSVAASWEPWRGLAIASYLCLQNRSRVPLPGFWRVNAETPPCGVGFLLLLGSLTITYFHTGNPHYHRR
ncbi:hypothetical protein P3T43_005238, partial [Paraburkholderia sp. GAS41]